MGERVILDPRHIIIAIVFSVVLFLLGLLNTFESIRGIVISQMNDVYSTIKGQNAGVEALLNVLNNADKINNENKQLRDKVVQMQSEISAMQVKLDNLKYVNDKGLADFDKDHDVNIIPVRILTYDKGVSTTIIINKGKFENINQGDVAVLGNYLLGIVTESYDNYSKIKLISTPGDKINVVSLENKTRGIMTANLNGTFQVGDIFNDKKLDKSDTFVTEGKDNQYPYGLIVGKVDSITSNAADPTKSAILTTDIDFKNLDRLYVMKIR